MNKIITRTTVLLCAAVLTLGGCSSEVATGPGVDLENKVVRIGALNDETGPGSAIGVPFAVGKRILAEEINAGGSGLLPEGWTVELVERNHAFDPEQAREVADEIKDDVLFIGTSYGTPTTLAIRPILEQNRLVAFPGSLSSLMADFEYTPVLAPSYRLEAMRAFDWAFSRYRKPSELKPAVIYQNDDYGRDAYEGWKRAAEFYGVDLVAEVTYELGQREFAREVINLKKSGANMVLMTTLPNATLPILGTAREIGYEPTWVGSTPSWSDKFFEEDIAPPGLFEDYNWVMGSRYWGEQAYQMDRVNKAFEKYGKLTAERDFYLLLSYIHGRVGIEAFRRALLRENVTREGYLNALQSIRDFDADGLLAEPIDLTGFPYIAGKRTRVLKPDFDDQTWEEVAPFKTPKAVSRATD